MLARLDRVAGVAGSRVEATGRVFALLLAEGADEAAVLAGAAEALRVAPRRLAADEAAAQTRAQAKGDPWFGHADVASLCYLEARILASCGSGAVARAAGLSPADRAALEGAFREELFGTMERVLAEGGRDSTGWFYEEWPALAARIAQRAALGIDPGRLDRAREALAALHARGAGTP